MADDPDLDGSRKIAAVNKSCRIVSALHELQGATLTQLAEHLELTPGTIHPHLVTLKDQEFIIRDKDYYYTSYKFLSIGESRKQKNVLYNHATNEIKELARETDSRVQIYIEEFGMAICIENIGSESSIYPPNQVGHQTHLHCLAAGKAILAELSREEVECIFQRRGLPEYTSNTITDEQVLYEELERISNQGYAINDEEYMEGLKAVGSPVTDEDGRLLGAISASVPSRRLDDSALEQSFSQKVSSLANMIELNIRVQGMSG